MAGILGEPHTTVHRALADLLADGIAGRVSHGTTHLPSSQRYCLTTKGIRQATGVLGFETSSDFVRAYPMSREWLTLLIRRMDGVASVYRLAASLSPGIDGLRSNVEFHRRGRFDAAITLHDGRSFGVVRRAIAREHELERTVREMERSTSELKLRASELERERDEARESASAGRQAYAEMEEAYRKETAEHKETKEVVIALRVTAIVLLALLIGSVLLWWFVLR